MKAFVSRFVYLGLGLVGGAVLAAQGVHAARPQDVAQPCSNGTVNVSNFSGKSVLNPFNGVRVMANHLYFHQDAYLNKAHHGYMFGVVHLTIHNGGLKPYNYNEFDYALHGNNDNANYRSGVSDVSVSDGLGAGTLPRGATVAGDVSFVVPVAQQGYTLQWTYDLTKPYLIVPINK